MRLNDLLNATNTVTRLSDAKAWAQARLLGEARRRSNEVTRNERRDRGQRTNTLIDQQGAFCELHLLGVLLRLAESHAATTFMTSHLYDEGGGSGLASLPDLEFTDEESGDRRGIDVKSFDCAANKRYFAINAQKHADLAGRCSYYYCVMTPPLGRLVATSKLVPYADVHEWEIRDLGGYGDPARVLPLDTFLRTYFDTPPSVADLRNECFAEGDVDALADSLDVRRELVSTIPALGSVLPR